ncbi:MAG: endonuclease [Oricola sp.]
MAGETGETQGFTVAALLARHGVTFCEELGIDIAAGTPEALFRWLVASLLMSARISSATAVKAARALADAGWTTPQAMAGSTWEERVKVLNRSGYARYDESTARMLGEDAAMLLDRYQGDLRQLREKAGRDPATERALLKRFKGIGEVGADIFCREAQAAWDELYPFADRKALASAARLGLPDTAEGLAGLCGRADFPRLAAALVRCALAKDHEGVLRAAGT